MNEAQILAEFQRLFDIAFRRTDVVLNLTLTAAQVPEWDSLRYVSFIMAIEERFQIRFIDADFDHFETLGDTVRSVAAKLQASPFRPAMESS